MARRPLVIDLFCGLGGWTQGFLSEGWDAIGFDIERHEYGDKRYPAQLALQDVLTLDGRQFRGIASMIVASPPCQEYSYMAMPWSRAKQIARALRGDGPFPDEYTGSRTVDQLNALFHAAQRIAREAELPIVIENVKGAQPWVGRAQANFGSYFLWGDIANMGGRIVRPKRIAFGMPHVRAAGRGAQKFNPDGTGHPQGSWFAVADSKNRGAASGEKNPGFRFDGSGRSFQSESVKNAGNGSWFGIGSPGQTETGGNPANAAERLAILEARRFDKPYRERGDITGQFNSKSTARKAASAMIAQIPYELSVYVARVFRP